MHQLTLQVCRKQPNDLRIVKKAHLHLKYVKTLDSYLMYSWQDWQAFISNVSNYNRLHEGVAITDC